MPVALDEALSRVREALLGDHLVRAVASGRRRGHQPPWRRVEVRPVDLRSGRHLQVTSYDATQAHTRNASEGAEATAAVDDLLATGFGSWHVETEASTLQLRVTKKGAGQLHEAARGGSAETSTAHDRVKHRLLDAADPWLAEVLPSRPAKNRQVEEFCRQLATVVAGALAGGQLRTPTPGDPLRVVDLGCGNAYLTFAAYRWLTHVRGWPVTMTGVDMKSAARERNTALAERLGADGLSFVDADIAAVRFDRGPEIVLALHACDTATDDALARALEWRAPVVLAAPCCHHHLQAQLRDHTPPPPYGLLLRYGILRERLADTLTDTFRAGLLRLHGYRVDVVEFVDSAHTPRNTLLRAVRTGSASGPDVRADYDRLVAEWQVTPRLVELAGLPEADR